MIGLITRDFYILLVQLCFQKENMSFECLDGALWRQGLDYRYAYGVSAMPPCTFANGLGKFDMVTGQAVMWREPGCIPGEPVMVPRPGAQVLYAPP